MTTTIKAHINVLCKLAIMQCALGLFLCTGTNCAGRDKEYYVYRSFSSEEFYNQKGILTFKKLRGTHAIAIVCGDDLWKVLLANPKEVKVELVPEEQKGTLLAVHLGAAGAFVDQVENAHYLFGASNLGDVTVKLQLPETLKGKKFRIVVIKTPSQTVL